MFARFKFRQILSLVVLTAGSLASANETSLTLSNSSCDVPRNGCPDGEEAYLRSYPDVAKNWRGPAWRHWIKYGKDQGKHYICMCPKSKGGINTKSKQHKNSDFVVVAVFKNEAMIFAEWISHYLWQGASHFYLIDDGSTDGWESTIPPEVHALITVVRNEDKHHQKTLYNSLLPMLRENHMQDWALIVDLDEFLYAKPPETIGTYLSTVSEEIGQVLVKW